MRGFRVSGYLEDFSSYYSSSQLNWAIGCNDILTAVPQSTLGAANSGGAPVFPYDYVEWVSRLASIKERAVPKKTYQQ